MKAAARQCTFGLDDAGKPHASRFSEADAELATKAATLMGLHVLRPATDDQRELAAKLPLGRVFASGRGFVPFVKPAVFSALAAAAGVSATQQAKKAKSPPAASLGQPEAIPEPTPAGSFGEIGVGSLVLALEGAGEGWFKAVVLKITDDKARLKWLDYEEPPFTRRVANLALLPPMRKRP